MVKEEPPKNMASRVTALKEMLSQSLHNNNYSWTPILAWAEEKTGVNRLYLFIGFIGFMAIYLVFGWAAQLISNTLGFIYPAYRSIKALESPRKDDDVQWLTYWVVFSFFSIIEYFSDILLSWFPFYWLLKCLFHIWCFMPMDGNGSMVIYHRIIRPRFLQNEVKVDSLIDDITDTVKSSMGKAANIAAQEYLKKDS